MKMPRIVGTIAHVSRNHFESKTAIFSLKSKNSGTFSGDLKMIKIKQIITLKIVKISDFKSNFLSIIKE